MDDSGVPEGEQPDIERSDDERPQGSGEQESPVSDIGKRRRLGRRQGGCTAQ
jgi:hypothetical protein